MSETNASKEGVQVYELGYLLLPSIPEENLSLAAEKIKGLISKVKGSEIESEVPQKIKLSYTMEKMVGAVRYVADDAYIGWIKFEAAPEAIEGLRNEMVLQGEVLRFLLIKATRETTFTFAKARELEAAANDEAAAETSHTEEEAVVQ